MKVYFSNANKDERFLATCNDDNQVFEVIKEFCYERDYNIPYFRCWEKDVDGKKRTWYDVGSWSEFFFVEE